MLLLFCHGVLVSGAFAVLSRPPAKTVYGVSPCGILSLFVIREVWLILRIVIGVLPTPHPTTVTEEIYSSVVRDSSSRLGCFYCFVTESWFRVHSQSSLGLLPKQCMEYLLMVSYHSLPSIYSTPLSDPQVPSLKTLPLLLDFLSESKYI